METLSDETKTLRRRVRDLVAISVLPAVWIGYDPPRIAESLADVLLSALRADFTYIRVRGRSDEAPIEVVRTKQRADAADQVQEIATAVAPWIKLTASDPPPSIPNPIGSGTVRLCVTPIGMLHEEGYGALVAGSSRSDFPTETDRLLLSVAVNQVTVFFQRNQAEEALRESELRFRTLFESMDEGYCAIEVIFDGRNNPTDYRFLEVNPQFEKQTGIKDAKGRLMREIAPDHEQYWFDTYGRIALTGETLRFENKAAALGRYYDVCAFRIGSAELRRVGVVFNDITGRKQAERARAHLAAIVESSDDAIISKDLQGIITSWNKGAEKVFGYTAAEAIGQPITMLIPLNHIDEEPMILGKIRRGEMVDHYETVRRRKDGALLNISLTISPIRDEAGNIIGASKIARDITEQKRAEAEREQLLASEQEARRQAEAANRMKDEFLATVSHELRTPLNGILGWARLLSGGRLDSETAARGLKSIEQNAKAQAQLIEDLLDVSRIISGKFRLKARPLEVSPVIEAAVDSVRPTADAKGVRLQVILDPDAGPVSGDAGRLQQVVWNLLSNGVKFTPKGGRVQVRLTRINSHIELEVSDTGQGIDREFLPYVFDRFRQADGSASRLHGGLGLGLSIVRHIVELHGGSVAADSPGKDQGSTFTIRLPLMVTHTKTSREQRVHPGVDGEVVLHFQPSPVLEGVKVLIVDDEPDSLLVLSTVLTQSGAYIKTAISAEEGFEQVKKWRPDVIVSDIGMPGEDGYLFMKRVKSWMREAGTWIPAVALTAYARAEDRMKALASGYQIHIPKPVEPAELITVVESLVERPKPPSKAAP